MSAMSAWLFLPMASAIASTKRVSDWVKYVSSGWCTCKPSEFMAVAFVSSMCSSRICVACALRAFAQDKEPMSCTR